MCISTLRLCHMICVNSVQVWHAVTCDAVHNNTRQFLARDCSLSSCQNIVLSQRTVTATLGFADSADIVATALSLQLPVLALHAVAIQGIQLHKWQMCCYDACHIRRTDNHDL